MNPEGKTTKYDFMGKVRESTALRFSVLFGGFFIFLLITSILVAAINSLPGSERSHLLWGSVVQNILVFCLPAYLLAKFSSKHPFKWLKLDTKFNFRPILGIIIVYVISMPAMDWLTAWNSNITFPESMSGLEATLRAWEDAGTTAGESLVDSRGILSLIAGILVVGVLTGFSEEIFFRGGLQGIFIRSGIGATGAIWMSACVFSALHFQFFGFVPRLLMGVFFGYVLIWTNDVKVSAFAHILNNSMVMILGSIYGVEVLTNTEAGFFPEIPYLPLISFIATVLFFVFARGYFFKNETSWQKRQLLPRSEN